MLEKENHKIAIERYEHLLKQVSKRERAAIKKELAIAYFLDQNHVKAFTVFLEALDEAACVPTNCERAELELYQKAYAEYTNQ